MLTPFFLFCATYQTPLYTSSVNRPHRLSHFNSTPVDLYIPIHLSVSTFHISTHRTLHLHHRWAPPESPAAAASFHRSSPSFLLLLKASRGPSILRPINSVFLASSPPFLWLFWLGISRIVSSISYVCMYMRITRLCCVGVLWIVSVDLNQLYIQFYAVIRVV